jgi:hypothetical protein
MIKQMLIAAAILASTTATAQELIVTATGIETVADPNGGLNTPTTVPVSMTFQLNLANTPAVGCGGGPCWATEYFTATVPATNWITANDYVGGKRLREFAPNGGNVGSPAGTNAGNVSGNPPFGSSEAFIAFLPPPANGTPTTTELLLVDTQVTKIPKANGAYVLTSETSDLRLAVPAATFINGGSLNQNFAWAENPNNLGEVSSVGWITRDVEKCSSSNVCTQIVNREIDSNITSATGSFVAPEIDASSATAALTLLLGGLIVLRGRRPARPVA